MIKTYPGFINYIDKEDGTLWFSLNIDDIEDSYESTIDLVIEEHRHLIKNGTYIHLIDDDETNISVIVVDEQKKWTQKELDNAEHCANDIRKYFMKDN